MNDLTELLLDLVAQATLLATLIVTATEAVRRRVSALDGWRVLVVAAVIDLVVVALFVPPTSGPAALLFARVAFLAWLVAVGGDAWVNKLFSRAGTQRTVIVSEAIDPAQPVRVKPGG